MRILTVDDDEVVQRLLEGLLKRHGTVERAYDGAEALERFDSARRSGAPYDLVVMDIMMPGMDGLSAASEMVRRMDELGLNPEERTRVVMLSCLGDPGHMLAAQYDSGADAYLTKPLEAVTLEETLASLGLLENPAEQLPD